MTTGLFIQQTSLENVQLGEIILHEKIPYRGRPLAPGTSILLGITTAGILRCIRCFFLTWSIRPKSRVAHFVAHIPRSA